VGESTATSLNVACYALGNGRYQVIFGDLRAETAMAERLRTLEAK
jgi:hypothetical protein